MTQFIARIIDIGDRRAAQIARRLARIAVDRGGEKWRPKLRRPSLVLRLPIKVSVGYYSNISRNESALALFLISVTERFALSNYVSPEIPVVPKQLQWWSTLHSSSRATALQTKQFVWKLPS